MMSIAQIVLAPVILGLAMNHFLSGVTKKIQPLVPLISSVAALVVVHNVCGLSLGYFAAKIVRMDSRKVRAVAIEVGMQNSALAVSLAMIYFTPLAAIPGAIFSVWFVTFFVRTKKVTKENRARGISHHAKCAGRAADVLSAGVTLALSSIKKSPFG